MTDNEGRVPADLASPVSNIRSGFATSDDGVPLYWRSIGSSTERLPPLVCCNGVGVSTFFFKYVAEHFRHRHQVLLWDYRGHGRSAPPPGDPRQADLSIARNVADLVAVLDDAGVTEPAVLLGHSMGVQVIIQAALSHPDRVAGLIPMFGTPGRPLDTLLDSRMSRPIFGLLHRLAGLSGRRGMRLVLPLYDSPLAFRMGGWTGLMDRHTAGRVDIDKYLGHLAVMDPAIFMRMVSQAAEHDAGPLLHTVAVPTLVLAGEKDLFTPLHRSIRMARTIPGAEMLVLAEASHAAIVEHPETINSRIERFLRERL